MQKFKQAAARAAASAGALLATGAAMAAPIDVSDVTAAIGETLTPIGLIGGGVLLVLVAVKTYKWVRRAM